jgi:rifampicin phosphotransferase
MFVLDVTDPSATSSEAAGAKAANVAVAAGAGFPTAPGFVLTTTAVRIGTEDPRVRSELRQAFDRLGGTDVELVVRSSSTIEDAGSSSMAGRFTSVLGVVGWEALLAAIGRVVSSADSVRDEHGGTHPIAVLVQRQLTASVGGVMFGVDPVTGDADHVVVEVVAGGPERLVGGTAVADHYVLSRRGRIVRSRLTGGAPPLASRHRRALVAMARRAHEVFGGPQDIEWLIDPDGALWLLQSRPVTAVGEVDAAAPGRHAVLFGPGPVAETFPEPLRPLEEDLWVAPLRQGLVRALRATGAVSRRALERSPVITTVGRRVAVDLELLGLVEGHAAVRRRLHPTVILRRLGAAWRVGRLRVALPRMADAIVFAVDRDLAEIPRLDEISIDQLVELLDRCGTELATVHTYEVVAGMLLPRRDALGGSGSGAGASAAGRALTVLADARAAGWDDRATIERAPIVLVLTPPRLGGVTLPAVAIAPSGAPAVADGLPPREALRARVRWLQELGCRVAEELGRRLVAAGALGSTELVPFLRLEELVALASGAPPRFDLASRRDESPGPALPTSFRLAASGEIRPGDGGRQIRRSATAAGLPAGGGRGEGTVVHSEQAAIEAAARGRLPVLVTRHLEPQLAGVLPHLHGLVAETGSALSHLAILAREAGVPTVVAVDGALERYPVGTRVVVDGRIGEIDIVERAEAVAS